MKRRHTTILAAGIMFLLATHGTYATVIPMDSRSKVTIEINQVTKPIPTHGYTHLRIRISNHSGAARIWQFSATSGQMHSAENRQTWTSEFKVENQHDREFDVLIPVFPAISGYFYPQLEIRVTGYGTIHDSRFIDSGGYHNNKSPYCAMSRDLAVPNEGRISGVMETRSIQLFASSTEVTDFGEDYRAYTGFDSVWLTDQTLKQLSPQQSMAMRQWVALGGRLRIFTPGNTPDEENGIYGFGTIEHSQLQDGNLIEEKDALHMLTRHTSLEECLRKEYLRHTWKMRDTTPDIRHPPILIMSFVIIFALLLGPVNILVAARRKRHSMILITTPVVSIAASVILAMLIIFKDGFGGTGNRITLAFLQPENHYMSIIQEQISRTGILLNRSFKAEQDLTVYPVNVDQMFFDRNRSYHLENGIMSGSWFTSRTIQGQLMYQITPTREHVEIYPCPDNSNPPEVVSAVNDKIKRMFYCDLENRWWTVENLHAGAKTSMRQATRDEYKNWWKEHRDYAGAKTGTAMDRIAGAKGMFFAEMHEDSDIVIQTLPSIRWKGGIILLTGDVVVKNNE